MKTILIAIPTAKYIEADTFKSIYDLEIPDGYVVQYQHFFGYNIQQIRNLIADWVIKGFDYLFSVDSDITFHKDTLSKLISHNKDIVTGIYRQRLEQQTLEIYNKSLQNISYNDIKENLFEIGGCGFGCVLVKKRVFVDVGYPQFVYHSALDHKNTISEDVDFCKKAIESGNTIWVDKTIVCGHIGQKTFEVQIDEVVKENTVEDRLRELGSQRLLPAQHVGFLGKLKREGFEPKVIYDIGACVLHWTNEAKKTWPDAHFYAFEAMDETKFLYEEAGIGHWNGVLTDSDNKIVKFNQNLEHPGGNSYYHENPELSPMANELWKPENEIEKVGMTLDTIIERNHFSSAWEYPDLIKMDVQGAELDILYGSKEVLKHCNHLILELQHEDYNIGAPKSKEVIEYMESLGFKSHGMFCGSTLGVDGDYYFTRESV